MTKKKKVVEVVEGTVVIKNKKKNAEVQKHIIELSEFVKAKKKEIEKLLNGEVTVKMLLHIIPKEE